MTPWLVDWWGARLYYEHEALDIEHQHRLISTDILSMYNRPQSVIDEQALHDGVYTLMGIK